MQESTPLFYQAATLMLVGMSFVFGFLSLLIGVIKLVISPMASRFPDVVPPKELSQKPNAEDQNPTAIVAAISVAVNQYRKKHR